jgi:hypothetical protein
MQTSDRARIAALALLAAVAGCAAVGIAALARAGVGLCGHRILVHDAAASGTAMAGMPVMLGMHHHHAAAAQALAGGVCPILFYAAAVAVALCVLAAGALLACRIAPAAALTEASRLVLRLTTVRLTALLALAGAVPLVAILAAEGGPTAAGALSPAVAALALTAGAFLTALALAGAARAVLALARRIVVALVAALRLLAPGSAGPALLVRVPVFARPGARLARRRPSRAPPARI